MRTLPSLISDDLPDDAIVFEHLYVGCDGQIVYVVRHEIENIDAEQTEQAEQYNNVEHLVFFRELSDVIDGCHVGRGCDRAVQGEECDEPDHLNQEGKVE